jgi:HTH-type transcriptional regulator/antitoxin HigA
VINNNEQYENALILLSDLMDQNPAPGSMESDYLDVLAVLIENYESKTFEKEPADPVEAILFRMDQMGLKNLDMVPYFGSKARVSEVLNRKRPLSLNMMRSLHSGLGISTETLMRESVIQTLEETHDWKGFPLKEMFKRGYFANKFKSWNEIKENEETVISSFLESISEPKVAQAFLKTTAHERSARNMDQKALLAWCTRVFQKVENNPLKEKYSPDLVDEDFIRGLRELSPNESGPLVAREFLNRYGVYLVIEPHLSKTYLDGAAFMSDSGHPVIAMTLRFDRIDNFWFVLMHELAHVKKHLNEDAVLFFDDLETQSNIDEIEDEADALAREWLIPIEAWRNSSVPVDKNADAALLLAKQLKIHPSIVVGRLQREENNYRLLSKSIGRGQDKIRRLFEKEYYH